METHPLFEERVKGCTVGEWNWELGKEMGVFREKRGKGLSSEGRKDLEGL
jgi:hypothetical protein